MTEFEKDRLFEYISELVLQGYIAGYDPDWKLTFSEFTRSELSEATVSYIAKLIKEGFTNGEIQEDDKQGWWFLKID